MLGIQGSELALRFTGYVEVAYDDSLLVKANHQPVIDMVTTAPSKSRQPLVESDGVLRRGIIHRSKTQTAVVFTSGHLQLAFDPLPPTQWFAARNLLIPESRTRSRKTTL